MTETPIPSDPNKRFLQLMRLGYAARAEGNYQQAHRFWRKAALKQPDNEEVWLALLKVVDNPADRQVCLENIVAINPENLFAKRLLDELQQSTPRSHGQPIKPDVFPHEDLPQKRAFRPLLMLAIGLLIGVGLVLLLVSSGVLQARL